MKPVIMRKQSILMFPLTEHERHVKRQVEYLPAAQVREEYDHVSKLIELADQGTLGFARAKISGMTWVLCRQYDQNPWQAICCFTKGGAFACGDHVKEEKPEVKERRSPLSARARRELARAKARQIMGRSPTIQTAKTLAAMAALAQPPRR